MRASGITRVNGNVVIDDRLFTSYAGFPDGLISPMWVNENLIDLLLTPTSVGQRATLNWRPMTATYAVTNRVTTVGAKKATTINVTEPTPGNLVVSGQIAAHSAPTLRVWEVDNPSAVRAHGLHRSAAASGRDGDGPGDRREPHCAAAAEGELQAG